MKFATGQARIYDNNYAVLVTHNAAMHVQIKKHKKTKEGEWLIVVESVPFAEETEGAVKKREAVVMDPAQQLLDKV